MTGAPDGDAALPVAPPWPPPHAASNAEATNATRVAGQDLTVSGFRCIGEIASLALRSATAPSAFPIVCVSLSIECERTGVRPLVWGVFGKGGDRALAHQPDHGNPR